MRKLSTLLIAGFLLALPSVAGAKSAEMIQLRRQQRAEMNALKLKEKYQKESWRGQQVPKAMREAAKHELQREKRQLRERQKDQRQEMKDRERMLKEEMKQLPPE